MRSRTPALALPLLLAGCKSDPPPAAAASTAEESFEDRRKRKCEGFAAEMARTVELTGQMMVVALEDDPEGRSAREGKAEMKAEAAKLRLELLGKCLSWDEETIECLSPFAMLRDGCEERLLAAMEGATPPPAAVTAGPTVAWSFSLEHEPRHLAVAQDGTVLVVESIVADGMLGLRDGAVAWRLEGDFASWLLRLPGPTPSWLAARDTELVAIDPATGALRWSVGLPLDDELVSSIPVAARDGSTVLVGDDEARFFRIDPAACGGPRATACLEPAGRLDDEYLDSAARLFATSSGLRLLWEDETLRSFDDAWTPRMTARAHDMLVQVQVVGDRAILVVDDEVVELEPARCTSEATFGPSGWPQPGALVFRDSDECVECREPPEGCRGWRSYHESIESEPPALLDDGTVVVHVDGFSLGVRGGSTLWKTTTNGSGPLVSDGSRVFGFGTGLREGDPPVLFELDPATGSMRWQTPLGMQVGDVYFSDDIRVALAGEWLVGAYEQNVVALRVPSP